MARYLVVAHQTASSLELIERLIGVLAQDSSAQFVLLVPATPASHLLTWTEQEAHEAALQAAQGAEERMRESGLDLIRSVIGDASPVLAVADEMREHGSEYNAIVVCTMPLGISRWLRLDLPHQVEKRFRLPVIHVIAQPVSTTASR